MSNEKAAPPVPWQVHLTEFLKRDPFQTTSSGERILDVPLHVPPDGTQGLTPHRELQRSLEQDLAERRADELARSAALKEWARLWKGTQQCRAQIAETEEDLAAAQVAWQQGLTTAANLDELQAERDQLAKRLEGQKERLAAFERALYEAQQAVLLDFKAVAASAWTTKRTEIAETIRAALSGVNLTAVANARRELTVLREHCLHFGHLLDHGLQQGMAPEKLLELLGDLPVIEILDKEIVCQPKS